MGYKLLRRTRIQVEIKQERHRISRDLHVSVDRVVQELARVGFADIRRLFDENGRMKPIADLDPETAAAISGIEFTRERTTTSNGGDIKVVTEDALVKVKFASKVQALEALAKSLGMFEDRAKVTGRLTLEKSRREGHEARVDSAGTGDVRAGPRPSPTSHERAVRRWQ